MYFTLSTNNDLERTHHGRRREHSISPGCLVHYYQIAADDNDIVIVIHESWQVCAPVLDALDYKEWRSL